MNRKKIIYFLLFILIMLPLNLKAQDEIVTLSGRNITLKSAFDQIEKQTKLSIDYDANTINVNQTLVSIPASGKVSAVLDALLNGTGYTYTFNKSHVIITIPQNSNSKQNNSNKTLNISGLVVDSEGDPLIGVTVEVLGGAAKGTITDNKGNYLLKDVPENATLRFSYIGMTPVDVAVKGKMLVDIIMQESNVGLDEVVVVGYGTMRKSDLTGSVASIKLKDEATAQYTSIDQLIQGKIPGMAVLTGTEGPSAFTSIRIRGGSSITGDNEPLYVIDNIPQSPASELAQDPLGSSGGIQVAQNPLISLNPQDIESIEILKDASSTAIYGSRGSNGVILITTKKGTQETPKISLSINSTFSQPAKKLEMLGLRDYAEWHRGWHNDESTQRYFIEGNEVRAVHDGKGGDYDPNNPKTYFVVREQNWQDVFYSNGFSMNYGVSVDGSIGKNTNYYLSVGYKDVEGIVAKSDMKQGDFRLNMRSQLNKKLSLELILSGSRGKFNTMQNGDLLRGTSTGSVTRASLDYPPHSIFWQEVDLLTLTPVTGWLNDYDDLTESYTFAGNVSLRYQLSKIFTYRFRIGNNINNANRARWFGRGVYEGLSKNGSVGVSDFRRENYSIENTLLYDKRFSRTFGINGVIGSTYDDYNSLNKTYSGSNFEIHDLRTKGLHLANTLNVQTPEQRNSQILSFLGRTNLRFYGNRYLATLTFRADGTSKFKNHKWGYFPSSALAWNIHEESFLKQIEQIDQLKLRLSWGQTGNQNIAPYSSINSYEVTTNSYATSSGEKTLATSLVRIINENLKWETTETLNLGLDFSIFNQRISGNVDVYRKKTKDLLIRQNIAPSNGFPNMVVNYGALENKGVEFSLSADVLRRKDFNLTVSGNIAFNRGKVLDIGFPESEWGNHRLKAFAGNELGSSYYVDPANMYAVGYEPGMFWGYVSDGIIKDKEDLAYIDENGDKQYTSYNVFSSEVGNYKFVDLNEDGVVDERDRTFIGNPNPVFTYGFQLNASYKKITISAIFNGVYGNDIMNANRYTEFFTGQMANFNIRKEAYDNMWSENNPNGIYPGKNSQLVKKITDIIIEDGSFLRLNDLTLSYELPSNVTKKIGIGRISIFATGKNLFVITGYKGYDPEVGSLRTVGLRQGVDWNSFARARTYTLGMNVNF